MPGAPVQGKVIQENTGRCHACGRHFLQVDEPLQLRIRSDIRYFVADIVGNVLELQRHQVDLVDGALHRLGYQRSGFGLLDGIGNGIRLVSVPVTQRIHMRIIGTEGDLGGNLPEAAVKIPAVTGTGIVHGLVVDEQRPALTVNPDQAEGDVRIHGGQLVGRFGSLGIGLGCNGALRNGLAFPRDRYIESKFLVLDFLFFSGRTEFVIH